MAVEHIVYCIGCSLCRQALEQAFLKEKENRAEANRSFVAAMKRKRDDDGASNVVNEWPRYRKLSDQEVYRLSYDSSKPIGTGRSLQQL